MKKITLLAFAIALSACQTDNPPMTGATKSPPPAAAPKLGPRSFEQSYSFARSEATGEQHKLDQNNMTVLFSVNKDGNSVNGLKTENFSVTENGVNVTPFQLASDVARSNQVAEIMLLVDITGTMVELIETAKQRLKEFVNTSRARGYHTRMCISTFGDYTVQKCERFFDIKPDRSTEAQVNEFLSKLARLQAYRGEGRDPGYPDLDENPMQALVDASKAPWGRDSQRFVVLVTDWGFLWAPGNIGKQAERGQIPHPPTMKAVTEALKTSQMKVFAVTRTKHTHRGENLVWDGYNTPFQGEESIVKTSGGEHFEFDKVMRKEITLDQIFERILLRIDTTYKITYVVNNVTGLKPWLPLAQRNVEVKTAAGEVKKHSVLSNMPNGNEEPQQIWKVSENSIQPGSMKVFMGDTEVPPAEFTVTRGEVRFKSIPPPGAKLRFTFLYEASEHNLRLAPISIRGSVTQSNAKVYLNGIEARNEDVMFDGDLNGNSSVTFSPQIMAANDPYLIGRNQGLKVKIVVAGD